MEFVVVVISVVNVAFGCLLTSSEALRSESLEDQCRELLREFSWDVANVTSCALENSYPYRRVCFQCRNQSEILDEAFDNLKSGCCFKTSSFCIVDVLHSGISDLWMKNNCDACFSHADEAKHFINVSEEVLSCLQGSNETEGDSQENSTCVTCKKLYKKSTEMYYKIIANNSTVCADVFDAMKNVNDQWQNCSVPMDTSLGIPNILTTVAVALLPVVFYTGAKLISSIEDVKLFHPKRRTFVQGLQG